MALTPEETAQLAALQAKALEPDGAPADVVETAGEVAAEVGAAVAEAVADVAETVAAVVAHEVGAAHVGATVGAVAAAEERAEEAEQRAEDAEELADVAIAVVTELAVVPDAPAEVVELEDDALEDVAEATAAEVVEELEEEHHDAPERDELPAGVGPKGHPWFKSRTLPRPFSRKDA